MRLLHIWNQYQPRHLPETLAERRKPMQKRKEKQSKELLFSNGEFHATFSLQESGEWLINPTSLKKCAENCTHGVSAMLPESIENFFHIICKAAQKIMQEQ